MSELADAKAHPARLIVVVAFSRADNGQMSKQRPLPATAALSFSLGLAACTANNDANAGGPGNRCSPIAAQTLVGRPDVPESKAKTITGAATIRRISPGYMVTQDFRDDRLWKLMVGPSSCALSAASWQPPAPLRLQFQIKPGIGTVPLKMPI